MFLVRWIRKALSLPFLWLGELAGMVNTPASVPLLKAAWHISGDGAVAMQALAAVGKTMGPAGARLHAAVWMQSRPRPGIAAYGGLIALEEGDTDEAKGLLAWGRMLGDDKAGMLDLLEYMLANRSGDADAEIELARRLELRKDLSPYLSKLVLSELLLDALMAGRHDEADRRADHLLEVEDVPVARMVKWALAMGRGDRPQADGHLAGAAMPPEQKLYYQALGYRAVGLEAEAAEVLAELRERQASSEEPAASPSGEGGMA